MSEAEPSLFGIIIGWLVAIAGTFYTGWGIASLIKGDRLNGVDGILFGGICLGVGIWVLRRRS